MRSPALALAALLALAPVAGRAQDKPISGVWMMQGYKSSQFYTARQRIGFTADGQMPPLKPAAAALFEERLRAADDDDHIFANNASRCVAQGLPHMIFAAVDGPIQIITESDQVTIISTELSETWFIYLNTRHRPDIDPSYHGDSIGHWEGRTLVVDTVGVSGAKTTVDQVGMPHSDALHLITRFRQTDADTLQVVMTIEDPETFTRPWDRSVTYKRVPPGGRVEEWVCENERNPPAPSGFQSLDGRVIEPRSSSEPHGER
jgi:hypothetical protein